MKLRAMTVAVLLAGLAAIAGCVSTTESKDLRVVELGEVPQGSYDLVERIWGNTIYTPFYVPWYTTREGAMDGLKTQASMRGADAVANAVCTPATTWWGGTRYFCHGDAVKMRPAAERPFFTIPNKS
jgi:hypothetical protein